MREGTPVQDNVDRATVASFGEEWSIFDQTHRDEADLRQTFDRYFSELPWDRLPPDARGLDVGCGSGRWAAMVAPRVGSLVCLDPSPKAVVVARDRLADVPGTTVVQGAAGSLPVPDGSCDFGYCLGVLHHTPDPAAGLADCVRCLRPGAPFLVYLYYALDDRPRWYRALWRASDAVRRRVSRMAAAPRRRVADVVAVLVYLPLARAAGLLHRQGRTDVPLAAYRDKPLHVLRTDAYDRFSTPLEHRFTRAEVEAMMRRAGLTDVRFRDGEPFWCAVGTKA